MARRGAAAAARRLDLHGNWGGRGRLSSRAAARLSGAERPPGDCAPRNMASTSAGGGAPNAEVDMANHESGITPQLQNVVATVNLGTKLDLKEIALHARNAEYNPKVQTVWEMGATGEGSPKVGARAPAVGRGRSGAAAASQPCNGARPGYSQLQRFAAVIMRIREPKTTALIFASGKMVSWPPLAACRGRREAEGGRGVARTGHRLPLFARQGRCRCRPRLHQVCTGAKSEDDSRQAARRVSCVL